MKKAKQTGAAPAAPAADNAVPIYLFKQGNNFEAQRFFGAHFETRGETSGVTFRDWRRAPRPSALWETSTAGCPARRP